MAEKKPVKQIVYVVPLKRVYWGRRTNRAKRAVDLVRRFVARHTKADRVVISNEVNNYLWSRSIEKPPRRVKILVKLYKRKPEDSEEEKEELVAVVRLAPADAKPGPLEAGAAKA